MRVVCAPDSFKGSLTAVEASTAMAAGVRLAVPDAETDTCPVGDGGEGTLEALLYSIDGRYLSANVANVFGEAIPSGFGLVDNGRVAFVESAKAIGLGAIPAAKRDVMRSSSFGVGQLVAHAARSGARKLVVGVGGSATNDGGCGMAQALGVRFFDAAGNLITRPATAATLPDIRRIDTTFVSHELTDIDVMVACDVDSPLTGPLGAAQVFAAQKGASREQVGLLDDSLKHLAELIRHDLGVDVEPMAGSGAAGGLGAGLVAFAGARVVSGIGVFLDSVDFDRRIAAADLCLTGEGSFDSQSMAGKACVGVANAAASQKIRTVLLAGRIDPGAPPPQLAGFAEYVVIGQGLTEQESIAQAAALMTEASCQVTKKYERNTSTI